ncbi:thiamine pyrophosphokinase [Clostridia bacterium]|nr:thiamine pyrophosphokinase [Clostridia bacterium]
MRAWIVIAGQISASELDFYSSIKPAADDLVVCADGGYDNAVKFGIVPSIIIGDMDSIISTVSPSIPTAIYPANKDKTDTHLAINYAIEKGASEIVILGNNGGRIGHTLANIALLRHISEAGLEGMLLSANSRICLLKNGETSISRGDSKYLSIIPLTSVCKGVSIMRAKYEMKDEILTAGDTRGVSNEFGVLDVKVSVKSGELLIIAERE